MVIIINPAATLTPMLSLTRGKPSNVLSLPAHGTAASTFTGYGTILCNKDPINNSNGEVDRNGAVRRYWTARLIF